MTRFRANMILAMVSLIRGTTFVVQQIWTGSLGAVSFTSARFLMGELSFPLPSGSTGSGKKNMDRSGSVSSLFSCSPW